MVFLTVPAPILPTVVVAIAVAVNKTMMSKNLKLLKAYPSH
jgi:hypothetical protein